jgi:hypothetical protein
MPYNEKTTMKPDGSKVVRKEHIDPTTGKCTKIEITEYPSTGPDFSVMSSINKKPKTTVIYPEDQDDTGFHSTLMPTVGKTTVGKTTIKTVDSASVPKPTSAPLKVDVPSINNAPVNSTGAATTNNNHNDDGGGGGGPSSLTLPSQPPADAKGGCCSIL